MNDKLIYLAGLITMFFGGIAVAGLLLCPK